VEVYVKCSQYCLFNKNIIHLVILKTIKPVFVFIFIGFLSLSLKAQDPIFSQFFSAPLQLNPAFAGNTNLPKFAINYRNQWPELNAYTTYSFSVDQFFEYMNSGFGMQILSDNAGDGIYKTTKLSGIYAYRARLTNDINLKFGVELGIVQARLNFDKLIFFDQLNPEFGPIGPGGTVIPTQETRPDRPSALYLDASIGGLIYSPNFYAGVSIKHLNRPSESILDVNSNTFAGLPMRFSIHGGAEFDISIKNKWRYKTFIAPNLMYVKQGAFGQLNAGSYFGFGPFLTGAWLRIAQTNPDAVIFLAGVKDGMFRITYSYDLTVSNLGLSTGGSHEIGIIINLEERKGYKKPSRYNDCFNIFR